MLQCLQLLMKLMSEVIMMRNQYKDEFHKKYGVKLGFMSFC